MVESRRMASSSEPALPVEPIVAFPERGPWSLELGARRLGAATRFRVWAPAAREVKVRVDGLSAPMTRGAGDVFEAVVPDVAPGARYAYELDGARERPDPVSRHQPEGPHGRSAVVDPSFPWTDRGWKGLDLKDLVFYELHVGTFTAAGTFEAAIERLGHLKALGVTMLELLPVAEFPGARNWGYDGVDLYAPHSAYGGPAGLKRLVDACHRAGLGVCLDAVYNHLGPEGNYLREFGPYFTDRYHTPWGDALNFDGAGSDAVRRWVIENALYWITEYHVDALRLDAVNHIFDFSALHVLQELKGAVEEQARRLGRRVQVIAESDLDDPRVVRPAARGGWGLDAQWSDDFHHAVHAHLTGERGGYYADFGGLGEIAKAVTDGFVFDGRYNAFRGRRLGAPARGLPGESLVICLQNHDQVGNRMLGERLTALAGIEAHRAAAVLALCAPQLPLLFMGEEWAESRPFLYFTSHGDEALTEAVRRGRRREFHRFGWREEPPDPHAAETFERSRLDWASLRREPHAGTLALYKALLALRRRRPALRNGRMDLTTVRHGDGWLAYERRDPGGDRVAVVCQLSKKPGTMRWPFPGKWRRLLQSAKGWPTAPGASLTSPPESAAVYGLAV